MSENGETRARSAAKLAAMELDPGRCYAALKARDARFDGRFFVAVSTTGIYCRPVCPARTPGRERCQFYPNAAAAERAGYRPCLRCRPELAPGYASVDAAHTAAHWAAARIEAGALNDGDFEALAAEYGVSSRQLRRVVEREFGASPVELAQTRRLLLAKQLLTDSQLSMADVAYAAGFASVRRFNHLFKTRYGLNPTALRRHAQPAADADGIVLKLAYRPPLDWQRLSTYLASRGAAGVECVEGTRYARSASLGGQCGWICAQPIAGQNALQVQISYSLMPVLAPLLVRLRQMFDLNANPRVIEAHLSQDARLARIVGQQSGLRVPGAFDGFELAVRAILGQQVTVKAASTLAGRLARAFGEPAQTPFAELEFYSPEPERIAGARPQELVRLGLTRRRAETIRTLAREVAAGTLLLEPGVDVEATLAQLQALPGIGPWTAQYVAMRALAATDAFPHGDLGLAQALELTNERAMLAATEPWRPWRAYAAQHLWASLVPVQHRKEQ